MKYRAFISYRHGGIDEAVATALHKEIEKYSIPGKLRKKLNKKKIGRAFRDNEELRASSDLSAIIREALLESEWLIVICTKRLPESKWCLEEIESFIEIRGRDRILLVLAEGEPDESFPKPLTEIETEKGVVHVEPLAVDIRGTSEKESLKKLKSEKLRLFAPILDVEYDDLRMRQRERRNRRFTAMALSVMIILGGIIGVVTYKNIQLNAAYDALEESNNETLKGESNYLCEYSDDAYKKGNRQKAVEYALEGLPEKIAEPDRPYVPRVLRYLTQATGVYDYSIGYKPGAYYEWGEGTVDVKTSVSEDGSRILAEISYDAAANTLTRYVRVFDKNTGNEILNQKLISVSRNYYSHGSMGSYLSKDGKTLIYLAEDGLKAVDIDTGKEIFTNSKASELKVDAGEKNIVAVDYDDGKLFSYDYDGEEIINCSMGTDINYSLGDISPDGKSVTLSANTEEMSGILVMSLKDGSNEMIPMNGLCSDIHFMDNKKLCFILTDNMDGLKHVVKYDMSTGEEGYLCNTEWDISEMTLVEGGYCYYYHDNRVYEVDGNSKKGVKVWEQVFASNVASIYYGDGIIAVSCVDGTVTLFDEKSKEKLDTITGSGETLYPTCVRAEYVILRDYWGGTMRIYDKNDNSDKAGTALDIADLAGASVKSWYTCPTDDSVFAMGFSGAGSDRICTFDGTEYKPLADKTLNELDMSSFENKELEVKNRDYITIRDFETLKQEHFGTSDLKKLLEIDEEDYYFYSEDGKYVYKTENGYVHKLDAVSGEQVDKYELPSGYDRGFSVGDVTVFGNDQSILIKSATGEKKLDDAVLTTFNDKRGLVIYRNKSEMNWYVYDVKQGKVVCEGESGVYSSMSFFCNNKYFFCDYEEVYDMDSWQVVLHPSGEDSLIYGIQTTEKSPYFVVWCQRTGGENFAELYLKAAAEEIVGVIPNFVSMTTDGQMVVYDGVGKLYKFPLMSEQELIDRARSTVSGK